MAFFELRTETRQAQALSPQQQYAVRLLQMSSVEFAAALSETLGKNPFLEIDEDPPDSTEEENAGLEQPGAAPAMVDAPFDSDDAGGGEMALAPGNDDRDLWLADSGSTRTTSTGTESSALSSAYVESTLAEHLLEQIRLLRLAPREKALASVIAESLDDDGYLRAPLGELQGIANLDPPETIADLERALDLVQSLEPLGVGARDIRECLALQLPNVACPVKRQIAASIIQEHMALLARGSTRALANALGREAAVIEEVCALIRRLDPRPGWRVSPSRVEYIVPDVVAKKKRGQWTVQLNPAVVPRVRLNAVYEGLFQRERSGDNGELAGHLHEARWTVRNVDKRFSTILEVARAIVRRQRHFFEFGTMAMKPMGLKDIADELGLHESTVSRATNNKYIATSLGVFELKYFFSRAKVSTNGSACSGIAIRGLINDMIRTERPGAPLSDVELARRLSAQGLPVGRRTVTKYRQMLGIEAAEKRRLSAGAHAP